MGDFEDRLRDAFEQELGRHPASAGLRQRVIRNAVAAPAGRRQAQPFVLVAAAAALVLVVVAGGAYALSHRGQPVVARHLASATPTIATLAFGPLPSPALHPPQGLGGGGGGLSNGPTPYYGPANLKFQLSFAGLPQTAAAYRFVLPDRAAQDAFASKLGGRASGVSDTMGPGSRQFILPNGYILNLSPTDPNVTPSFTIVSRQGGPPSSQLVPDRQVLASASSFLSSLGLTPSWPASVSVARSSSNGIAFVQYQRLFDIGGGKQAGLIDDRGDPAGLQVVVAGTQVVQVTGYLAGNEQSSYYPLIGKDQAISVASKNPAVTASGSKPNVTVNKATVTYMLLAHDGYGYLVPAYLLTGSFEAGLYEMRVLVPAVANGPH